MKPFFETIRDVKANQESIRSRPYGMIEAVEGKLSRIQLKPWPKYASLIEAHWIRAMKSKRHRKDVCRIFYNQPMGHRNFLALAYAESSLDTTRNTIFAALGVLDQIAYIKQSAAIIAEVSNKRITDRALRRAGWERYMEHKRKRHWIKRFYGEYPEATTKLLRVDFKEAYQSHLARKNSVCAAKDN